MGTTRERPVFDSSIVSAPVRKSAQRQGQPALLTPPQASVETYEEQRPMLGTERPVERAFARWGALFAATQNVDKWRCEVATLWVCSNPASIEPR